MVATTPGNTTVTATPVPSSSGAQRLENRLANFDGTRASP
jgi:hypothetical protein